jgi:hypothetical protein
MRTLAVMNLLFIVLGGVYADITFEPTCNPGDVLIDTVEVEGTTYHTISIEGFPLPMNGIQAAGLPSVPFTASTFLVPPGMGIDTILIISAEGRLVADEAISEILSGSYILEPADTGILPAGLYTVVIEGIGEEELVRQVIVLP